MKIQILLLVSVLFISSCTQTAFRWRNDDGDEVNATWRAEINEPAVYDGSGNIRLRLQFAYEGRESPPPPGKNDEPVPRGALYYSLSTDGPWTKITDDMNNAFVLSHSNYLTHGELTTNRLPPVPNKSFKSGQIITSTFLDMDGFEKFEELEDRDDHFAEYSEFEWSIKSTPNTEPNIYYFTAGQVYEILVYKENVETSAVDDQGNNLIIPYINDYARLIFAPKTIPLRNWSVAILVVLISGFLIYSFRKKLA